MSQSRYHGNAFIAESGIVNGCGLDSESGGGGGERDARGGVRGRGVRGVVKDVERRGGEGRWREGNGRHRWGVRSRK